MRTHLWNARHKNRCLNVLLPASVLLGAALVVLFSLLVTSGQASAQPQTPLGDRFPSIPQAPLEISPPYSTTTEISSVFSVHPSGSNYYMVGFAVLVTVDVKPGASGLSLTPEGTVNVTTGGGPTCDITLSSGSGTCALFFTTFGNYTIDADYTGVSGTWDASSDSITNNNVQALALNRSLTAGSYHSCSLSENGSFKCWGLDLSFPNTGGVPDTISEVKELSGGGNSTCALKTNGTAQCWGDNSFINTVPGDKFLSISTGKDHVCAVDTTYHLNCWGDPQAIPLTTTVGMSKPTVEVKAVTAGNGYDCAIKKADDKLDCWGSLSFNEADLPPGMVKAVSVGERHACAILNNDKVQCWGNYSVSFGNTQITEIDSGSDYTCARQSDGKLICAGNSSNLPPVDTNTAFTGFASDFLHTCALQSKTPSGHYLACWGNNDYGQAPSLSLSPTSIQAQLPKDRPFSQTFTPAGGNSPYSLVKTSGDYPAGLSLVGFVLSDIPNTSEPSSFTLKLSETPSGALPLELKPLEQSYNTTVEDANTTLNLTASPSTTPAGSPVTVDVHVNDSATPVLTGTVIITGSIGDGAQQNGCTLTVDSSGNASCALFFSTQGAKIIRGVYLGNQFYLPSPVASQSVTITAVTINPAISAGNKFNCSIDASGAPYCWGKSDSGQTSPPSLIFSQISSGQAHVCGRALDGKIDCWGWNGYGVATPPTDAGFTAVTSGATHACALTWDGKARCWGNPAANRTSPPSTVFSELSAGWDHTCGRSAAGDVSCWGVNSSGQTSSPAGVLFSSISAGGVFTCGILSSDGSLQCWGSIAAPPSGTGYKSLDAGYAHACAIRSDDSLVCWGSNSSGQSSPPDGAFSQVSAGFDHTCAIRTDGFMQCWGNNAQGQGPVISILPTGLPTIDVDVSWSTALAVSGGRIPTYTFSSSGSFPDGLALDSSTGVINGTPALAGHYSYTVHTLENGLLPALIQERSYNQIVRSDVAVSITSVTPPTKMVGRPVLVNISASEIPGSIMGATPTLTVTVSSNDGKSCKTLLSAGTGSCYLFFTSSSDKELSASYVGDANFKPGSTVSSLPISIVPFSQTPDLHTGLNRTYFHKSDGTLKCLGSGCSTSFPGATLFPDIGVSDALVCVIRTDGTARCKKDDGSAETFGSLLTQMSVGLGHACAIDAYGRVVCWGDNAHGQATPPGGTFSALSAAGNYTCGIHSGAGAIECWGEVPAAAPGGTFSALSAGLNHACAISATGVLICWGDDTFGQSTPPSGGLFSALSVGERHSCALGQDGKLVCWGEVEGGRSEAPYGVFTSLASYANHNCALRSGPMLTCWGVNESGEAPRIGILDLAASEIPALHYFEHGFYPADGSKPYQGSVTSGSLPPGIHLGVTFSPAGVVLFGTPSLPDVYPFVLSWQDAADIPLWREQPYTLTVTGADLGVKIIPAHPQTALYGTPFSFQYVFTNATVLDVPQVQLSIKLPQGLSGVNYSGLPGCLLSGLDLGCTIDPMGAWASQTLTVTGVVSAPVGTWLTTTVDIQSGQTNWPEIAPGDNHDQVAVQVDYQSLAFADTFSSSPLDIRWSDGERLTTTTGIDYLGDFTSSDELHLILENLPPHRRVTVSFDLYVIGAWQGNAGAPVGLWQFGQAGQPALLSTTFCNEQTCQQAFPLNYPDGVFAGGEEAVGMDELGYSGVKDTRYHLSFSFRHKVPDLDLLFRSLNLPPGARWGLDNILVVLEWSDYQVFLPVLRR
jgi:alpha-tubulin suppressor-like RCC1 family protein